ncbi:hypothetical protein D9M71_242250 [compost metagenome]
MGKPPKLRNYPLMPLGVIQVIGKQRSVTFRLLRHQFDIARDTFVLHREVFAVLEHQIDEHPLNRLQLAIEIRRNTLGYQFLCAGIAGECFGSIAKDHSRDLIEQQHQGQPTFWTLHPLGQSAGQCLLGLAPETLTRFEVLAVALAKPQLALLRRHFLR